MMIEELNTLNYYHFNLAFELPLDLSVDVKPEINAHISRLNKKLRPNGLLISGIISEKVTISFGDKFDNIDQNFHFKYLIPQQDLKTKNLLNYDIEPVIEQIDYYLIKRKGQVFLKQKFNIKLMVAEYQLKEDIYSPQSKLEKKSGFFLKKVESIEKSFLKVYQPELPQDFSSLSRLTGRIEEKRTNLTEEGCFVDCTALIQGEYITHGEKIGTFFFEKREDFFIPISQSVEDGQLQVNLKINEILMEDNDQEIILVINCQIEIFKNEEINYYIDLSQILPRGTDSKFLEVFQSSPPYLSNTMLDEELELKIDIKEIEKVEGWGELLNLEQYKDKIILTVEVEYLITYIDKEDKEKSYKYSRQLEEMIQVDIFTQTGKWEVEIEVEISGYQNREGRLIFNPVVDYRATYHYTVSEQVLIKTDQVNKNIHSERLYVKRILEQDKIVFQKQEKIFLHRYASQVGRIDSRLKDWTAKEVEGGWLIKSEAELTLYYQAEGEERHFSHTFSYYQYLPGERKGIKLDLEARIKTIDYQLEEDGSLVLVHSLITFNYNFYHYEEEEVVTELAYNRDHQQRPVLSQGVLNKKIVDNLSLDQTVIKKIENLNIHLQDYEVVFTEGVLSFDGRADCNLEYLDSDGQRQIKVIPIKLELKEEIGYEGDSFDKLKCIPEIKEIQYLVQSHPHRIKVNLIIKAQFSYRLIGMVNFF